MPALPLSWSVALVVGAVWLVPMRSGLSQPLRLATGTITVQTPSWGDDCGPVLRSERDPAGTAYENTAEGHVVPTRKGRLLFGPGVCRQATGVPSLSEIRSGRRIACKTATGSSKQVRGTVTKAVADDGRVTITHRFDYEWRLKGTLCRLSTRGRWTFADRLPVKRLRTRAPKCDRPGPVARLVRLDPPNLSVGRDASRQLRVRALDANGCRVTTPVRWRASAGRIDERGTLFTEGVPRGDRIEAIATAGKAKALFVVTVGAVDDPLPALSAPQRVGAKPAPRRYGVEVTVTPGSSTSGESNLTLVAMVVLLAGVIGALALRRRRNTDD